MYRLFHEGKTPPKPPKMKSGGSGVWGHSGEDVAELKRLRSGLGSMSAEDRDLLLFLARQMAEDRGPNVKSNRRKHGATQ